MLSRMPASASKHRPTRRLGPNANAQCPHPHPQARGSSPTSVCTQHTCAKFQTARHTATFAPIMSAFGGKADLGDGLIRNRDPNVRYWGLSGRSRHAPKESAYSHKRTLRLSVLAPRIFVLAIQSATFRSSAWRAARVQRPRALISFIFLCLKKILTSSLTTD